MPNQTMQHTIINMTPHIVNVMNRDGSFTSYQPSGKTLRVPSPEPKELDPLAAMTPNIPEVVIKQEGKTQKTLDQLNSQLQSLTRNNNTFIITSFHVFIHCDKKYRRFILRPDTSPSGVIRDKNHRITGVKQLLWTKN